MWTGPTDLHTFIEMLDIKLISRIMCQEIKLPTLRELWCQLFSVFYLFTLFYSDVSHNWKVTLCKARNTCYMLHVWHTCAPLRQAWAGLSHHSRICSMKKLDQFCQVPRIIIWNLYLLLGGMLHCKAIPIKCFVPIALPLVKVGRSASKKKEWTHEGSEGQWRPGC